ncbi:hypothetical protein [Prochlorothrix hollandica]|uniref:DUF2283 domain-containing protein n=1 Tax=Prochlorothrix hollandica PCC 9006 = CALU 1027 TaxID=317619 RepID=A0A0M2PNZ3_PROHO|nr:hypothetical protein [Prochlorothrix hollandica]KKI97994.1 hypothetical protein PROH_19735 [Prochlorothrix hollandica PCC 9006 = CALU 1027]
MAQVNVYYEPETEVLTVFWQSPRKNQICTELDNGLILIKDETTGEAIGLEILSYRPGDTHFDTVSVHIGQPAPLPAP